MDDDDELSFSDDDELLSIPEDDRELALSVLSGMSNVTGEASVRKSSANRSRRRSRRKSSIAAVAAAQAAAVSPNTKPSATLDIPRAPAPAPVKEKSPAAASARDDELLSFSDINSGSNTLAHTPKKDPQPPLSIEADRRAKEQAEKERVAKAQAEKERIAKEQAEKERIAKAQAEKERIAKEQAEKERIAKEQAEKERVAKVEKERNAKEQAEKERIAKEQAEKERVAKEQAEKERVAKEQAEKERVAKEGRKHSLRKSRQLSLEMDVALLQLQRVAAVRQTRSNVLRAENIAHRSARPVGLLSYVEEDEEASRRKEESIKRRRRAEDKRLREWQELQGEAVAQELVEKCSQESCGKGGLPAKGTVQSPMRLAALAEPRRGAHNPSGVSMLRALAEATKPLLVLQRDNNRHAVMARGNHSPPAVAVPRQDLNPLRSESVPLKKMIASSPSGPADEAGVALLRRKAGTPAPPTSVGAVLLPLATAQRATNAKSVRDEARTFVAAADSPNRSTTWNSTARHSDLDVAIQQIFEEGELEFRSKVAALRNRSKLR